MGQLQRRNAELVDLLSADFVNCWMPIEQVVLNETFASVTFEDIPQIFRSLVLLGQIRSDRVAELDGLIARFNGDDGDNYSYAEVALYCNDEIHTNCARHTSRIRAGQCDAANSIDDTYAPFHWNLSGYLRTDRTKWLKALQSGPVGNLSTGADMRIVSNRGFWETLEPITSITVFPEIGPNLVPGCILELYGVL